MYKTNYKHQIEMYVLNVSIRNYCFDDNTEIIVVNIPFLLGKVVLVDTLGMYVSRPAVNVYLLLSVWQRIVPAFGSFKYGRKHYLKKITEEPHCMLKVYEHFLFVFAPGLVDFIAYRIDYVDVCMTK